MYNIKLSIMTSNIKSTQSKGEQKMTKEHIYFVVEFNNCHKDYMSTTLPLWEALRLYYQYDRIKTIKMITKEEYYENIGELRLNQE